jgi:PKD repeat protein
MRRLLFNTKLHRLPLALFAFIFFGNDVIAQLHYRVLFLGNSYTGVNDLPQVVHDVALSAGDTLTFDSNTPGGYQLIDHTIDPVSQSKIMTGGWNYVIIQGQSQEPIIYNNQFMNGGRTLNYQIKEYNPCAVTMTYMTWGRKNGDAANCPIFPEMCTYEGMDTTLRYNYLTLTSNINAEVSPVSVVWNFLRQNYPNIELYQPDDSHPSTAGSYAAACCFYSMIFKKDPTLITYNFGLNAVDAITIRNATKALVFDSLQQWDFKRLPIASFAYQIGAGTNEVIFNASSFGVQQSYSWDFGDGDTSSAPYTTHTYLNDGTYTVTLTTSNCDLQGIHTSVLDTVIQFCSHTPTVSTSHGWLCEIDTLWTEAADSYQWYNYGTALSETNQYLANPSQYAITGFSVLSTTNGCSEISRLYTETPEWSGYYFDSMGDPCAGDTVAFAVLHINGSLSGTETILWYKNDTLLSAMTNEDTLLISSSGTYECRVVNSNSNCPYDTTYYAITYNCNTVGIVENQSVLSWNLFPNPASETITVQFAQNQIDETIRLYNVIGKLIRSVRTSSASTEIEVADLPGGLYLIQLKDQKTHPLKFIKQ